MNNDCIKQLFSQSHSGERDHIKLLLFRDRERGRYGMGGDGVCGGNGRGLIDF